MTPLNSLAFLDEEFVSIRPKGNCVHLVFAGDSYVIGDGVDREKSFFQLIKQWSAREHGERGLRFFNIAQRATTIEHQLRRIRETFPVLDPDIVILGQFQNDLTDLTKPGFVAHELPDSQRWKAVQKQL